MHQRAPTYTLTLVASSSGDLATWYIDRGTVSVKVSSVFCHGEAGKMVGCELMPTENRVMCPCEILNRGFEFRVCSNLVCYLQQRATYKVHRSSCCVSKFAAGRRHKFVGVITMMTMGIKRSRRLSSLSAAFY
jgi:hypothetical protein